MQALGSERCHAELDSDICAMLGEELCDASADTAPRPGNKSLFTFKKFCCHVFAPIPIALVIHFLRCDHSTVDENRLAVDVLPKIGCEVQNGVCDVAW